MNRGILACAALILSGLSVSPGLGAEPGKEKPALSVRIESLQGKVPTAIDYQQAFGVVLTNESNRTLRLWETRSKQGFYQVSFRFKNLRTGENSEVRRPAGKHKYYWGTSGKPTPAEADICEIDPRDSYVIPVKFDRMIVDAPMWIGLPDPNSEDSFEVTAEFESRPGKQGEAEKIWAGKISSAVVKLKFQAERLTTPLAYLRAGFEKKVIRMLAGDPEWKKKIDPNLLLQESSRYRRAELVKWLLEQGAEVESVSGEGKTALDLADEPGIVELLLKKSPDLSIGGEGQGTPLQNAVKKLRDSSQEYRKEKWEQIVKLLLKHGAVSDLKSAIYLDDLKRVKELLEKEGRKDPERIQQEFRTAAELGSTEICRYFIEQLHVDVNDFEGGNGYPVIYEAVRFPRVVELLIRKGADLKTPITWRGGRTGGQAIGDDATMLHFAAAYGEAETINLLIQGGIDVFAEADDPNDWKEDGGQFALEVAGMFGNASTARALVTHPDFEGAEKEDRQEVLDRSLVACVKNMSSMWGTEYEEVIKILLEKGADPNGKEKRGTAMQLAASQIHPENYESNAKLQNVYRLLKKHGAQVDIVSAGACGDLEETRRLLKENPKRANERRFDGYPLLHLAVGLDDREVVAELIRDGVDVNLPNKSDEMGNENETALHAAAWWGRPEMAKILIDAGANVNAVDKDRSTPLHEAVRMGKIRVARLLLERGANLDAKDNKGVTPRTMGGDFSRGEGGNVEKLIREKKGK